MIERERFFCRLASDPRFAVPGTSPSYLPDRNFKVNHIKLELDVDVKGKVIHGVSHIFLESLGAKALTLNAVGMKINSVKIEKKKTSYKYDNEKIEIPFEKEIAYGQQIEVSVDYKVSNAVLGVYFRQPDKKYPKRPWQAWSHSEAEEARFWYPCIDVVDARSTTETVITVPGDFFAVSNGKLVDVRENKKNRTKTYHWKMGMPHSTYLVAFAAGKFTQIKEKWRNVDVLYYCEKGREQDARRAFGKTPDILEFFSKKIGVDYPYEKYAQAAVSEFTAAGMENTTITLMSDTLLLDKIAEKEVSDLPIEVTAHEAAHQWFGDLLTCKDWSHGWLNEGFATYFAALYAEKYLGRDKFLWDMYKDAQIYFDEDANHYRRPIVTNIYSNPDDIFDAHLYQKAAWVLHAIRNILGEKAWWKAIHFYVKKNRSSSVETSDFIDAIRIATGINTKKLFEQWVFKAGHPEYLVKYSWDPKKKEASVRIVQQQILTDETPLFSMPVTLEFHTKNGTKTFKEVVENKQHIFKYKLLSEPAGFNFDPENYILKKSTVVKPKAMWYRDLRHPNVIERIRAVQAIASFGSEEDAKILEKALYSEKFWGTQVEIVLSIGTIKSETAFRILSQALARMKHPRVKRASIDALGNFDGNRVAKIARKYTKVRNSVLIPAEAFRTLGRTKMQSVLPLLAAGCRRESYFDAVRIGCIAGMANVNTEKAVGMIKEKAEYGNPQRSRTFAVRTLGMIGKGRKDVVETLLELTHDSYSLVRGAAVEALGTIGDEAAMPRLREILDKPGDTKVKRDAMEAIRKIQPWLDSDLKTNDLLTRITELQTENEKLRRKK